MQRFDQATGRSCLLLPAYLLLALPLLGQLGESNPENMLNFEQTLNVTAFSPGARSFDNRYEGVKGSPYVFDDWRQGDILVAKKDSTLRDLPVNFNTLNQTLVILQSSNSMASAPIASVREIRIRDGSTRLFRVYDSGMVEAAAEPGPKLYEVLHENNLLLLKAHDKYFQEADYKGAYSSGQTADEFFEQPKYYLRDVDGPFQAVKLRPKNLEKAIPEQKGAIKRLAREMNLTLYQEAEWVRLLQALDH